MNIQIVCSKPVMVTLPDGGQLEVQFNKEACQERVRDLLSSLSPEFQPDTLSLRVNLIDFSWVKIGNRQLAGLYLGCRGLNPHYVFVSPQSWSVRAKTPQDLRKQCATTLAHELGHLQYELEKGLARQLLIAQGATFVTSLVRVLLGRVKSKPWERITALAATISTISSIAAFVRLHLNHKDVYRFGHEAVYGEDAALWLNTVTIRRI